MFWEILSVLINFFLMPIIVVGLLEKFAPFPRLKDKMVLYWLGLGFGPNVLAWILGILFMVVPRQELYLYRASLLLLSAGSLGYFIFNREKTSRMASNILRFGRICHSRLGILWLFIIPPILFVLLGSLLPWDQNDPLEYAQVARQFFTQRTLLTYPFLTGETTGGLTFQSTHLPGYPLALAAGMVIRNSAQLGFDAHFYSVYYFILIVLSPFLFRGLKTSVSFGAAIIYAWTPFIIYLGKVGHVDLVRFFFLNFAVILGLRFVQTNILKWWGLALLVGFFSCFFHSLGVLSLFFLFLIFLVQAKKNFLSLFRTSVIFGLFGLLLIIPYFVLVVFKAKTFLADNALNPILAKNLYNSETYFFLARGLVDFHSILSKGLLQGFNLTNIYGSIYKTSLGVGILLMLGILFYGKKKAFLSKKTKLVLQNSYPFFSMYLVASGLFLLGKNEFLKNPRYLLSIHFFAAIAFAYSIHVLILAVRALITKKPTYLVGIFAVAYFAQWFWGLGTLLEWQYPRSGMKAFALKNYGRFYELVILGSLFFRRRFHSPKLTYAISFLLVSPWILNLDTNVLAFSKGIQHLGWYLKAETDRDYYLTRPQFQWLPFLTEREDSNKILTWRQADLGYHIPDGFYNQFDPRVISVFAQPDITSTWHEMLSKDIGYLHLPAANFSATFAHTMVEQVAADPKYSRVIYFSDTGDRIIKILSQPINDIKVNRTFDLEVWRDSSGASIKFPASLDLGDIESSLLDSGGSSFIRANEYYVAEFAIEGQGMVNVSLVYEEKKQRRLVLLWRGLLDENTQKHRVAFLGSEKGRMQGMVFQQVVPSRIKVGSFKVFQIDVP